MTEPITPGTSPNRLPLILGAGAGALLLIFVLSQVLSSDDDEAATTTPVVPAESVPVVPTPTTVAPSGAPTETFETFNTKNPFVPLRIIGGGGSAAGAATSGTTSGGTTTGGATTATTRVGATGTAGGTTTSGTSGGTGTTGSSGSGGTATEPRRGARVALLDVFAEGGKTVANVRINDTVHKVTTGQVFATSFKVVSLSQGDECGRFLFGDDAFRLCKGEESLK